VAETNEEFELPVWQPPVHARRIVRAVEDDADSLHEWLEVQWQREINDHALESVQCPAGLGNLTGFSMAGSSNTARVGGRMLWP
jgi:hypothetical protein